MRKKRIVALGFILIALGMWTVFALAGRRTLAQQQQQPQGEQTAEQRYKNIQVLKGMPESQLQISMNFMRASLGVSCAYCHVVSADGKWAFDKDDKPEKQTARRMIQMVLDINRGNRDIFGGATVTCFTCHRGSTVPMNVPQLPVPAPEGGAAGMPKAAPAEALPTAAQLVDKYLQAIGGRGANGRLERRVMKGTLINWEGKESPLEVRLQAGKALVITGNPQQGTMTQGFNGTTGWIKTAKEQREMRGGEVARFRAVQQSYEVVQVAEAAPAMKVVGREKVGDREAYVVMWPVDERRTQKLYFDTQTGLLLRTITYLNTMLGPIPSETDFEDYRDVDGVKIAFTVRQSFVDPWAGSTRKFTEVKANVPADDAQFNPPPAPPAQK
jgi:hypothetical protein